MEKFDIFNATQLFNGCPDMRPWLVVHCRGEMWSCFPISSHTYNDGGFFLPQNHPDFHLTGLSRECYILDDRYYELASPQFKRKRGVLAGALREEFEKYAGV